MLPLLACGLRKCGACWHMPCPGDGLRRVPVRIHSEHDLNAGFAVTLLRDDVPELATPAAACSADHLCCARTESQCAELTSFRDAATSSYAAQQTHATRRLAAALVDGQRSTSWQVAPARVAVWPWVGDLRALRTDQHHLQAPSAITRSSSNIEQHARVPTCPRILLTRGRRYSAAGSDGNKHATVAWTAHRTRDCHQRALWHRATSEVLAASRSQRLFQPAWPSTRP